MLDIPPSRPYASVAFTGRAMESWLAELERGRPDPAWDLFLDRYRRLIFAAIRHYTRDHDDVMDVFTRVCEALREDDLRRLRAYARQPTHRARRYSSPS